VELRIIGCGNADRGDDAAGLLVARRLRMLGIDVQEHSGDGLELLEGWRGRDSVVLIDTVVTSGAPGTITVWDGREAPVIEDYLRSSTHAFGVAEAVKLARILDLLPERIVIYGIEGAQFEAGTGLSAPVAEACEQLAKRIAQEECQHVPGCTR
jgi:hydrogenase maturation protease